MACESGYELVGSGQVYCNAQDSVVFSADDIVGCFVKTGNNCTVPGTGGEARRRVLSECVDNAGWLDSDGFDCQTHYDYNWCANGGYGR